MQNLAVLSGNIGQDPKRAHIVGGTSITTFTLATSRNWKNEGYESKQQTEWHCITVFGKAGENVAKYCKKGLESLGSSTTANTPIATATRGATPRSSPTRSISST